MKENFKTHAFYVIGILVAIVVVTITAKFGATQDVKDYLTFGASLASLVLAMLAIIYAFLQNQSAARNTERLGSASELLAKESGELARASGEVSNKAGTLERTSGMLTASAQKMESASTSLSGDIEKLRTIAKTLSEDGNRLAETSEKQSARIDELILATKAVDAKVESTHALATQWAAADKPKKGYLAGDSGFTEKMAQHFAVAASYYGLLSLAALNIAFKKKKVVLRADIASALDQKSGDYMHGFIVASEAAGIISSTQTRENGYSVESFNEHLSQILDGRIEELISMQKTDVAKAGWQSNWDRIKGITLHEPVPAD